MLSPDIPTIGHKKLPQPTSVLQNHWPLAPMDKVMRVQPCVLGDRALSAPHSSFGRGREEKKKDRKGM